MSLNRIICKCLIGILIRREETLYVFLVLRSLLESFVLNFGETEELTPGITVSCSASLID